MDLVKQAIQMLSDRVLVQVPAEGERKSRAGIGPHVRTVKIGDQVLFNPEDRFEVDVQGDDYLILRERDIHAVASEQVSDGTGLYL